MSRLTTGFWAVLLLAAAASAGAGGVLDQGNSSRARGTIEAAGLSPPAAPAAVRPEWAELIGDYGTDRSKLYVLERAGKLDLWSEGMGYRELQPFSIDAFQLFGRGGRERVVFVRDPLQAVSGFRLGASFFPRRPEDMRGHVFQITPAKPVDDLQREALASSPPVEGGKFLKPDLVRLTALDPTIKLDIRYASSQNFLDSPLYLEARAYLERPAAEALARVSKRLRGLGYGLLVYDAYRPWYVTKMFWDGAPRDKRIFVANPRKGSRHNRGCAVDLTLYDLKTGQAIPMTGGYDEMSDRSYPFYPGGTSLERWDRDLLRRAMRAEGFTVNEYEWWHFDYKGWRNYPILNLTFEQLDQLALGSRSSAPARSGASKF